MTDQVTRNQGLGLWAVGCGLWLWLWLEASLKSEIQTVTCWTGYPHASRNFLKTAAATVKVAVLMLG